MSRDEGRGAAGASPLDVDGVAVGASEFLRAASQSVASEGPELKLALRVHPGA